MLRALTRLASALVLACQNCFNACSACHAMTASAPFSVSVTRVQRIHTAHTSASTPRPAHALDQRQEIELDLRGGVERDPLVDHGRRPLRPGFLLGANSNGESVRNLFRRLRLHHTAAHTSTFADLVPFHRQVSLPRRTPPNRSAPAAARPAPTRPRFARCTPQSERPPPSRRPRQGSRAAARAAA